MELNKNDLLNALKSVKPGISDKEVLQQTNHYVFDEDCIRSYNDQIAIYKGFESGLFGAVKASEFYQIIEKIPSDIIEIVQEDGQFKITTESIDAVINIQEQHAVPLISIKELKGWQKLPGNFAQAVEFCLFSVSKDMSDPIWTCLYVDKQKVFSSDRFRVTRYKLDSEIKKPFLLKSTAARYLHSYKPTHVLKQSDWIHFKNKDDVYFSCRVMNGKYADVDSYFVNRGTRINLPSDLKFIIDRVQIMTEGEFKQDLNVEIKIKKGQMTCTGQGSLGYIKEKTKIDYDGDDIKIKIHPVFLNDILERLDELIITRNSLLFKGEGFDHIISLFGG